MHLKGKLYSIFFCVFFYSFSPSFYLCEHAQIYIQFPSVEKPFSRQLTGLLKINTFSPFYCVYKLYNVHIYSIYDEIGGGERGGVVSCKAGDLNNATASNGSSLSSFRLPFHLQFFSSYCFELDTVAKNGTRWTSFCFRCCASFYSFADYIVY